MPRLMSSPPPRSSGYEWGVFRSLLAGDARALPGQILVELHFWDNHMGGRLVDSESFPLVILLRI
jgi:hypothetical protein